MVNASNKVKCPLLWEFWIYNFSRINFRKGICWKHIRNECLFSEDMGEWIRARNKQIVREQLCGSRSDLFVLASDSFPMNPEKKTLIRLLPQLSICLCTEFCFQLISKTFTHIEFSIFLHVIFIQSKIASHSEKLNEILTWLDSFSLLCQQTRAVVY